MDLAQLGFSVDASQTDRAAKSLGRLEGSARKAETATERMNRENSRAVRQMHEMNGAGRSVTATLTRMAGVVAAAFSVRQVQQYADTWSDLTSRIQVSVGAQENATEIMGRLSDIARMTYSNLESTADSFARNSVTLKALGKSTQEQLDYTEALNNALVVSGAKAHAFEMVQNGLSRAMAEGAMKAQELDLALNYGTRVAELLADELGVNINQLRGLAAEGRITGDVIYSALTRNMELLAAEAESMPATIGDAFILMRNAALQTVGVYDQQNSLSEKLAASLIVVADNLGGIIAVTASAALGWGTYAAAVALWAAWIGRATIAQNLFNIAARANPYILAASAIVATATALWSFRDAIHSWIDPAGAAEKKLRDLRDAKDGLAIGPPSDPMIEAQEQLISAYERELDKLAERADRYMEYGAIRRALARDDMDSIDQQFQKLTTLVDLERSLLGIMRTGRRDVDALAGANEDLTDAQEGLQKAFERTYAQLHRQVSLTSDATHAEQLLYEMQHGRLAGLAAPQQALLNKLAEELDASRTLTKQEQRRIEIMRASGQLRAANDAQWQLEYAEKIARYEREGNDEALKQLETLRKIREIQMTADQASGTIEGVSQAPGSGMIDPLFGGAMGEIARLQEQSMALEAWRQTELAKQTGFLEAKAIEEKAFVDRVFNIHEQHQAQMAHIEQARMQLSLSATEQLFGSLTGMAATFAGEQSGIYKTMFAMQKAAAIAQSMVAIQQGMAMAAANPWPANLAAMASVAAATAGIVSNIAAVGMVGFQQGGYTGNMGVSDIAGVVHGREFVFDAAATSRIGVNNLEAMRSGRSLPESGGGGDGRPGMTLHQSITINGDPDEKTIATQVKMMRQFREELARDFRYNGPYMQMIRSKT